MKKLPILLLGLALSSGAFAASSEGFNTFATGLSAANTLVGTEPIVCTQSGASVACTPSILAAYIAANQATIAAATFLGNPTGSAAQPSAMNALSASITMRAALTVKFAAANNIATLSGTQTVTTTIGSTVSATPGMTIILTGQSSGVQNGPWLVNTGAWTRPFMFPTGFTIPANCTVDVFEDSFGFMWSLSLTAAVTVDTSIQTWTLRQVNASSTTAGAVTVTDTLNPLTASASTPLNNTSGADCANWTGAGGIGTVDITDQPNIAGNNGGCVISDANGHPILQGNGTGPTVTGSGCSKVTGSQDNAGAVAATGADTCTVTFGSVFGTAPFCVVAGYSSTVLPHISTAPSVSAFSAATAAAGTFSYYCSS